MVQGQIHCSHLQTERGTSYPLNSKPDFQSYARIEPSINYTIDALNNVLHTQPPVTKMEEGLQVGGRLFGLGLHHQNMR